MKPYLTEEPRVYACNALSNVSLNGNILFLEGPLHLEPGTMTNNQKRSQTDIQGIRAPHI